MPGTQRRRRRVPRQVLRILERRGCKPAPDDLSAVRNNTYQMLNLLAEDRPRGEAARGPILDFVASENLLERLLCWHLQGDFTEERKVEQLKLYEMLISQARQPLLRHKPVLTPLLRLLSLCAEPTSAPLENSLVLLLNQLCVSVAKEPSILELFFHSHTDQGPANLIIFSLLIPFIHHEGVLGQQARDALLLIMAMSASNHAVAKSITDNSYFCPVRLGAVPCAVSVAGGIAAGAGLGLAVGAGAAEEGRGWRWAGDQDGSPGDSGGRMAQQSPRSGWGRGRAGFPAGLARGGCLGPAAPEPEPAAGRGGCRGSAARAAASAPALLPLLPSRLRQSAAPVPRPGRAGHRGGRRCGVSPRRGGS